MKLLWAMEREALLAHMDGRRRLEAQLGADILAELATRPAPEKPKLYEVRDGDAHIPIAGVLSNHRSWADVYFGEAPARTYDEMIEAVWAADADPLVKRLVLDVDTGGGELDGLDDAAQAIAAAEKPVLAIVRNMAASAGYWLASQADEIRVTSPVATVGSIGVIAQMYDISEWLQSMGVKPLLFVSTEAPEKRALWEPATDAGREAWIRLLDDSHAVFAARVAQGRHTTVEKVNTDFGCGGLVAAAAALTAGMIDEIDGDIVLEERPPDDVSAGEELDPAHSDREEDQAHSDLQIPHEEGQVKTLTAIMAALAALSIEELQKQTPEDREKVADLFGFKAELETVKKQLEIETGKVVLLTSEVEALQQRNTQLDDGRIKSYFDRLVASGKLSPKTRPVWEEQYRRDPAGTEALLAAKGREWDPAVYGTTDPGPEPAPRTDIEDPEIQAALKKLGWSDAEIAAAVARAKKE